MLNFLNYLKQRNKIKKEFQKDEEGRAVVNISIRNKDEVLSPFCYKNKEIINEEFAGLLDNIIKSVPPKQKVKVSVKCDNITESEKEIFANATKNYYENKIVDSQLRMRRALGVFAFCLILSALSLALLFLAYYFEWPRILTEVVDIMTWVFVWETFDISVFQCNMIRLEKAQYMSLYKSKISFN